MTREEIMSMVPGRMLDSEIALRLFEAKEITVIGDYYWIDESIKKQVPNYSTDWAAAGQVVEKMSRGKTDCSFVLEFHFERYFAEFGSVPIRPKFYGCKTAPEAICKAALLVLTEG